MQDKSPQIRFKLFLAVFMIVILLIVGTIVFSNLEGWNRTDSFYFTTMTLTTVGYGDLVPITNTSKIVTSIFALLGVSTFLFALGVVSEYYFHRRLLRIKDYSHLFKGMVRKEIKHLGHVNNKSYYRTKR